MADISDKIFLDLEGLTLYDELIKDYIGKRANTSVAEEKARAEAAEEQLLTAINTLANGAVADNTAAIAKLNGDKDTEGSVAKAVADAIDSVVASAPETFDTLKEIADWISSDETGTTALINRVSANEEAITDLRKYVDNQDTMYYNSIKSIEDLKIEALFPVEQAATETAVEAIANVEEGKAVKLTADQTIADDLTITKSCYIDANGSTFTGTVTVPADVDVVIENATFSNPVVIA